jgi:hypothetical protein
VSGQLHATAALFLGKSFRYLLYRRLGGPQSRSARFEKRELLTLPGLVLRTFSRPAHSPSLYRLLTKQLDTSERGLSYMEFVSYNIIVKSTLFRRQFHNREGNIRVHLKGKYGTLLIYSMTVRLSAL